MLFFAKCFIIATLRKSKWQRQSNLGSFIKDFSRVEGSFLGAPWKELIITPFISALKQLLLEKRTDKFQQYFGQVYYRLHFCSHFPCRELCIGCFLKGAVYCFFHFIEWFKADALRRSHDKLNERMKALFILGKKQICIYTKIKKFKPCIKRDQIRDKIFKKYKLL